MKVKASTLSLWCYGIYRENGFFFNSQTVMSWTPLTKLHQNIFNFVWKYRYKLLNNENNKTFCIVVYLCGRWGVEYVFCPAPLPYSSILNLIWNIWCFLSFINGFTVNIKIIKLGQWQIFPTTIWSAFCFWFLCPHNEISGACSVALFHHSVIN